MKRRMSGNGMVRPCSCPAGKRGTSTAGPLLPASGNRQRPVALPTNSLQADHGAAPKVSAYSTAPSLRLATRAVCGFSDG